MDEPCAKTEGIIGMSAAELIEAASDEDVRLGGACLASVCAAFGAALLSRAACGKGSADVRENLCSKSRELSLELAGMAARLDAADELLRSLPEEPSEEALSAGADASVALLEACYFGQSLAKSAADSVDKERALDLGVASMLLDAAAGSALLSANRCLSLMRDQAAVAKSHELVWAITHDRIGAKKQVLDMVDAILSGRR